MALLLDRESLGRRDGIAPDLSEKMAAIEQEASYKAVDESFDLVHTRLWLDEYSQLAARGAEIVGIGVEDRVVDTPQGAVTTRVYAPGAAKPTLIFVHGGGWVIGSIATHDHIARWLASHTGCRVIQIEYSLAPEHPYPVAVNEIRAVISSVLAQTGGEQVLVIGDSAGANLAAMSILRLTDIERRKLAGFVSIYGAYAPEMNLSSHRLYGDGRYGLSEAQMRWFWNLYAPHLPAESRARQLSPLTADLSDFPTTLCIGAECDILLDDTLAFYGELSKASVDVSLCLWAGLPHGCMHFVGAVESVTQAAGSIAQFVRSRAERDRWPQGGAPAAGDARPPRGHGPVVPLAAMPNVEIPNVAIGDLEGTLLEVEPQNIATRSRLHGSLAHRIAADIITGKLPSGSQLPNEDKASASFGASRSAYREAIRTLAAKGLLLATPKVGTWIAKRSSWHILDPDILAWHFEVDASEQFIQNLFELRKIVEPSAAALAAMRRNEEELSSLADALARMARTSPRTGDWLDAIIAFHSELLVASRNEAVASLWPAIETTLRWSVRLQMMLPEPVLARDPVADHASVFERIASRSAEGALTEMALLIDAALADTIANLRRVESGRRH